jgi:hypothetical protein
MCHLAAACRNVPVKEFPVDILGPLYYSVKPKEKPICFQHGHVFVPEGHGLGVQVNERELLALRSEAPSR